MNEKTKIVLFGERKANYELGRFAKEIKQKLETIDSFEVIIPHQGMDDIKADICIYVSRSPRQLSQAVSICERNQAKLLVLSTDVEKELKLLNPMCKVEFIPNSSIEVQEYIVSIEKFWSTHKDWPVSVIEYHQSAKTSVSGTAIEIAKRINLPAKNIVSVRDDSLAQKKFNIPQEHLNGYAIHQVTFTDPEGNHPETFEMKVFGRASYVNGLIRMIKKDI
jgi:dihydrodipicolinate reductase